MIQNLRIFSLTVGETVTFQSLDSIKDQTGQDFKWTIWYDTCGRGIDMVFFEKLLTYTDDVILLNNNHGTAGALAYALLYLDFDHLLFVPADCVLEKDYADKFEMALKDFEPLACVGSVRVDGHPDFVAPNAIYTNNRYFMPDGVMLFSKEAINRIGGLQVLFEGMGMEQREWLERAGKRGYNLVSMTGIMKEVGSTHDGRKLNPNLNSEIEKSSGFYRGLMDKNFENYEWFDREAVCRK